MPRSRRTRTAALVIDVDTAGGRVRLIGKAPNEAAREPAIARATAVNGVHSVNKPLVVSM